MVDSTAHPFETALDAGFEAWAGGVRKLAESPDFSCSLPGPESGTGFDVGILRSGGLLTVSLGGLLHDCEWGLDEALMWAKRAWTPGWQLRIEYVGGRPVEWTLENALNEDEAPLVSGVPCFFRSWRRSSTTIRCNTRPVDLGLLEILRERAEAAPAPASLARKA